MRRRRLGSTRIGAGLALGPVLGAALVLGVPAPSYADVALCVGVDDPSIVSDPVTEPSAPIEELQIMEVHELLAQRGRTPGGGIGVAVLDSGIVDDETIVPQALSESVMSKEGVLSWHQGTAVGGLIAGLPSADGDLVGIAPAARLVDLRVYDAESSDEEQQAPTVEGVVAGLVRTLALVDELDIRVVNVSFPVERSPELDAAVEAVTAAGVIVVAASGDRSDAVDGSGSEGDDDAPDGEDTAQQLWPAGYSVDNPRVLAVSTTDPSGDDSVKFALQSSAIDVAVPTAGAVSYAINGESCEIEEPSTAWAAAEVSGILTLVMSAFPEDTPEQILARLQDTATGNAQANDAQPNRRTGRGVVQPLAAIERVIDPSDDGDVSYSTRPDRGAGRADIPVAEPDRLASTRRDAVWWGLGGGGALIVAMLLRPVLARRRS